MEVKEQVIQRFRDMRDEKLKALLKYHRKYAELIKAVLDERKKE
jgi:vacuolar-type H+-ATPase subunit E/Vma4